MKKVLFLLAGFVILLSTEVYAADMVLDSFGNVGIGTDNPDGELEVASDTGLSRVVSTGFKGTSTFAYGLFIGRRANGTVTSPSAVVNGDTLGGFGGSGWVGNDFTRTRGRVDFIAAENWTESSQATDIRFMTTPFNSTSRTERMRITSEGKVGIGKYPTEALDVVGNVNTTGSIVATSFTGDGASLINIGSSALTAGAVTSSHIAYYSDVAIVALSGGDYTDPYAAMQDITTWCNPPTGPDSTHPCLLKLMPGIYNIGTNTVAMQSYCDIEGSGQYVTSIEGNVDSLTNGVVNGQQHAEIRFLRVENTGNAGGGTNANAVAISNNFAPTGPLPMRIMKVSAKGINASDYNIGIQNIGGADPRIELVRAVGSSGNYAVGVLNEGSSPTLEHVYATGHFGTNNYGVLNNSASPTLVNVTASANGGANYGVYTDTIAGLGNSVVTIRGSSLSGNGNYSVHTADSQSAGSATYIAATELMQGTSTASGGTNTCAGVWSASLTFYASTCP